MAKSKTAPETAPTIDEGSPNLRIWTRVQTTDPTWTKGFSRGGGFKGTAVNHVYQSKRATEIFGPKGIGWGSVVLDERYADGAPIVHATHGVVGRECVHVLRIELWYVLDGQRGSITAYGQTTFVGSNKHGYFTDEEAPKKSLTDAESKALSALGFSADVHMGLFDDVKYVNDLSARVAEAERPKGPSLAELTAKVEAASNLDELKAAVAQAAALNGADRTTLRASYTARKAALEAAS